MVSRTKSITMDDIAKLANVSKPTVSRALAGNPLVNSKTREHVLAIARQYGYAVNRNAQNLRQKRSNTIAVSIDFHSHRKNHVSDPFIFELLAGVSEALGDLNQDLLLTAPAHNCMEPFRQMLLSRSVDGFIFLGQGHREAMITEFAETGAPMVVWGARRSRTRYCVIGSDNRRGGKLAGEYFIRHQRQRFLFVGDTSHYEPNLRFQGLQDVASKHSGVTTEVLVPADFSYATALSSAKEYLAAAKELPDAIMTYSDSAAMAFIRAIHDAGLRVPEDISIVGYNDIPPAQLFQPAITTIRQDTHLAGALLVSRLMDMISGKRVQSKTMKTELIVRET